MTTRETLNAFEPVIEMKGLTKHFGSTVAVQGLDLQIRRGEIFGFLGPNGAGKTTTIRMLLDLLRPTSGSATVFGLDVRDRSREIRGKTGHLPGELELYENMTGHELLSFLGHMRGQTDDRLRDELAAMLKVPLDRKIGQLSKGNKQKVGIIQAFMHRPEVLILDEPTGGLDPLMQQIFHDIVRRAAADGATVFLSSHVLSEVEHTADRVGMIRDGELVLVDEVHVLKAKAVRTFEIHFAAPVPESEFASAEGVRDIQMAGAVMRASVEGRPGPLLRVAARYEIVDLISREPDLSDIFLGMYGGEDAS